MTCTTKRGMTRERWEEIHRHYLKQKARDRGSLICTQQMLIELVEWIDNEGGLMDFDEPDQPTIPPSESNGEGARAEVIDGPVKLEPGEWETEDGRIVAVREWDAPGGRDDDRRRIYFKQFPEHFVGEYGYPGAWDLFSRGGKCVSSDRSKDLIRKHAPSLETKLEPALSEELAEGEWFLRWRDGSSVKAHLHRPKFGKAWIVETERKGICTCLADGKGICDLFSVTRRVRPPRVEPYVTDEEKGRMFWKALRRKRDSQEFRVVSVSRWGVNINGGLTADWLQLATDYEHLDSSPCGILREDDGTD